MKIVPPKYHKEANAASENRYNHKENMEVQAMLYQTTHYVNPKSKRPYRLELYEDLLGDFIVTAFNGSRRVVHCHSTLKAAQHFYQEEHQRRIKNKYEVCTHEPR